MEKEREAAARAVAATMHLQTSDDSTKSDHGATSPAGRIQFVPLSVPPNRRAQTATVTIWGSLLPLTLFVFFYLCSIPPTWPVMIIYIVWAAMDTAPARGGRPSRAFRELGIWKLFAGYFPIRLVKTADLPADRTYVFGYHPHGIIGVGAIANFGTEATGFSQKFPGITPHLLTVNMKECSQNVNRLIRDRFQLTTNFKIPFYRDLLLLCGICSVSYRSCSSILRKGPGNSLTIVVGGAAESLFARPGTADLTLKKRLGFIKLAIKHGADLVPVFSFGENDIFEQLSNEKGTKLYALQKRFQSAFGFTLPIFHGRGILNYTIGFLPYRHPIVSVVGRPIKVKQSNSPTLEHMQEVQNQYITELMRIWDEHKDSYATNRRRELSIVD